MRQFAAVLFLLAGACRTQPVGGVLGADGGPALPDAAAPTGTPRWQRKFVERIDYRGVWGSSASDVYLVGAGGAIEHSTDFGASWTAIPSGLDEDLNSIWGSAADDIYIGGSGGTLLHWDGQRWTKGRPPLATSDGISGIWQASASEIFLCGGVTLLHSGDGGASWQREQIKAPVTALRRVWGWSSDRVFALGRENNNGVVLRRQLGVWDVFLTRAERLDGLAGTPIGLYVSGSSGLLLRGGNLVVGTQTMAELQAVWGGEVERFVVGAGTVLRGTDSSDFTLEMVDPRASLQAVWGSADDDVYAAGDQGVVMHRTRR